MKQRSTTPVSHKHAAKVTMVVMAAVVASSGLFQLAGTVFARDYEAEIRAKQQEADAYNAQANQLGQMAATLEEELGRLTAQVNALQAQIDESQAKINSLNAEIVKNQEEIEKSRKVMGQILSDIYVDDQISPLEMLASSENIGDFIDKQEQRNSLKSSLSEKIAEIKELQKKLEENKKAVEKALADQQSQKEQMAAKQAEQASLVQQTRNDQATYNSLASQRNSEIERLREEQRRSNCASLGGTWTNGGCLTRSGSGAIPPPSPGNGGYPAVWANAPMDSLVDSWGMYNRECVSYVAWKIANSGRHMPYWGGRGHAYQWPGNARSAGIPTGSAPKAGAAAVSYGGPYGHIMYVESVNGDGTITVSDYNLGVDGLYRYYSRSASGLTYIYF